MKTYRALLLLFALLLTASLHAQNDTLRILAIGNSFADDGIEYLDEVARSAGKHIVVANTYIGGCSIARHLDNARHDRPAYLYRKNIDGKYTEEHDKTLHDAIRDEAWDYIVFQQVSDLAGQYGTYFPDLAELMDYVRPLATNPHVQYALQQTWAYARNSTHPGFYRYGKDQQTMYDDVVFAYNQAARRQHITIVIPTGTAIQNARSSSLGDTLCRDGYHLNLTYGRYTAACTWFETFFGEPSTGIAYRPEGVSEAQAKIAQQAAHAAILCPTAVTDLSHL